MLNLGSLRSIGPVIGEKVDFDTALYSNALRPRQCLIYHRDRNEPREHCRSRLFAGGLEGFCQAAHTSDGWAASRAEPDSRRISIPDAVLADATTRLDSTREDVQAGRLAPLDLVRLTHHIAAVTDRPWQMPALRQLLNALDTRASYKIRREPD